ncbi:MAG: hypothetical protein IJV43_08545 [Oscillospiraceae bacterium]|nr:hypothetical protein [Oscillospiraceae bacterium]
MQKDYRQIQTELARPFAPEDLEWRIQVTTQDKSKGLAVPYVTNRAIQDRLDDVVGPENWRNDYKPWHKGDKKEAQLCGISIYLEDRKEWLTKWDGAEDTDIEPVKGGLSDSMKRAAVQFGIGRVLYKMNTVWVQIEQKGKSFIIKDQERPKLDKAYMDMLERLGLKPAQPGGLQSQLTPKADKTAPQDNPAPEVKPQQQPQRQQQPQPTARQTPPPAQQTPSAESGKVTNFPVRPQWQYKIVTATIQPGMTQECMSLEIVNAEGKKMRAFYPTVTEELAQGTELSDVTLVLKKQGTVAFYMLKSYRIAAPAEQAA